MKSRRLELGHRNIIGKRVTEARQQQGMKQVELLAKLQLAPVSDIELNALADVLNISVNWLLGREK